MFERFPLALFGVGGVFVRPRQSVLDAVYVSVGDFVSRVRYPLGRSDRAEGGVV